MTHRHAKWAVFETPSASMSTNLIGARVVVGSSSDHKQLVDTAGDGWRADGFLHGCHFGPAVRERVVAFNAA